MGSFAIRPTIAPALALAGAGMLAAFSAAPAKDRGRPVMTKTTLVADNGVLLRGGYTVQSPEDDRNAWLDDLNAWKGVRDKFHLNCMRVYAHIGPFWAYGASARPPQDTNEVNRVLPLLDRLVELASQAGMYIIIDDHSGKIGDFNMEDSKLFWRHVAPRYKDRTHVIYDIKNEPVGGDGTMDKKYAGKQDKIAFESDMFKLIRALAPQTHITVWSFCEARRGLLSVVKQAPDIDYSNATVSFHPYCVDADWGGVKEVLDAGYPMLCTELGFIKGTLPGENFASCLDKCANSMAFTDAWKISWQSLNLEGCFATPPAWPADDGSPMSVIHGMPPGKRAKPVQRLRIMLPSVIATKGARSSTVTGKKVEVGRARP